MCHCLKWRSAAFIHCTALTSIIYRQYIWLLSIINRELCSITVFIILFRFFWTLTTISGFVSFSTDILSTAELIKNDDIKYDVFKANAFKMSAGQV